MLAQSIHVKIKQANTISLIIFCFCSKSQLSVGPEQKSQVVGKCAKVSRTGIVVTALSSFIQQPKFAQNCFLSTGFFSNGWELEPCFSSHIAVIYTCGEVSYYQI